MNPVLFVVFSLLIYSELQRPVEGNSAEARESIVFHLLSSGNKLVRPDGQAGGGSPVVVTMGFELIRIVEVDEVRGIVKMMGYLHMTWNDPRMAFMAINRHNVSSVRLDASDIWTPDIELYQPVTGMRYLTQKNLVIVQAPGNMTFVPAVALSSFCEQSAAYYHSAMDCTLQFGSWVYSGSEVDVQVSGSADSSENISMGRWSVESASVNRTVKHYSCCPDPYVTIQYTYRIVWR